MYVGTYTLYITLPNSNFHLISDQKGACALISIYPHTLVISLSCMDAAEHYQQSLNQ